MVQERAIVLLAEDGLHTEASQLGKLFSRKECHKPRGYYPRFTELSRLLVPAFVSLAQQGRNRP